MLSGFTQFAFSEEQVEVYDENAVEDALRSMDPYVTIDERKFAEIHLKEARENEVSDQDIRIVIDYVAIINQIAGKYQKDPEGAEISNIDNKKFSKFFEKIKTNGGDKSREVQTNTHPDYEQTDTHACDVWGPHEQPPNTFSITYPTRVAAIDNLSSGYQLVADYASHNEGNDYADWIEAYGCADGVFRLQSIVFETNQGEWQFSEHHWPSEPNPEIFDYDWPVWWWGLYVIGWHH